MSKETKENYPDTIRLEISPAPWTVRNNSGRECEWFVCNVKHSQWPLCTDIKENDALLIATAPDMYQLLKDIYGYGGTISPTLRERVRRLFLKAEGID